VAERTRKTSDPGTSLLDRLRASGWRMTAQRRAVAEALSAPDLHVTADEVFDRAAAILPEISRATVYNTLNDLVALGEVRLTSFDGGQTRRYDPNARVPHHHLVCTECGTAKDVLFGHAVPPLSKKERQGYDVDASHIVFEGVCADCKQA
jgi:Fur family ferric uptake transcriptional regulator